MTRLEFGQNLRIFEGIDSRRDKQTVTVTEICWGEGSILKLLCLNKYSLLELSCQ